MRERVCVRVCEREKGRQEDENKCEGTETKLYSVMIQRSRIRSNKME